VLFYLKNVLLFLIAQATINPGNLFAPLMPIPVLHIDYLFKGPVEVICNKGYLLVNLPEGVAFYSPWYSLPISNCSPHFGHVALTLDVPSPLILL
jgi:hypothetical protein